MIKKQSRFPRSVCLRVTRRCNAACSFCQAPDTSRAELSVSEIGRICEGLSSVEVKSLKLSGGEPTVRPDLPSIIHEVRAAGLKPVVITNGLLLRDRVLDAASAEGAELKFSVHRPDSSNDRVLNMSSFGRIVANMAASRRRDVPFSLNTVVTAKTVDLMGAMTQFAIAHGARKISFIPIIPRGRALEHGDEIDTEPLQLVRELVEKLSKEHSGALMVHCIDIRRKDYWIIENDGTLWIERAREDLDVRLCGRDELLSLSTRSVPIL